MAVALPYAEEQLRFCRQLPKIELHAHLNGSIRDSTIRREARGCLAMSPSVQNKSYRNPPCMQRIGREARSKPRTTSVSIEERYDLQSKLGVTVPNFCMRTNLTYAPVGRNKVFAGRLQAVRSYTHHHYQPCCDYQNYKGSHRRLCC